MADVTVTPDALLDGADVVVVGPEDHLVLVCPPETTDDQVTEIEGRVPEGLHGRVVVVRDPYRVQVTRPAPVRPEEGKP